MKENTGTESLLTDKILRYCAWQERSSSQVARKLRDLEATEAQAAALLAMLAEQGYVSDERFAKLYVRAKQRAGWGPVKITMGLRQAGISKENIEAILSEATENEEDVADAALAQLNDTAQKKLKTLSARHPTREDLRPRLIRFLLQRGFLLPDILNAEKAYEWYQELD